MKKPNIQILLVGKNHDHIYQTVAHYKPILIWLITSEELELETKKLKEKLLRSRFYLLEIKHQTIL